MLTKLAICQVVEKCHVTWTKPCPRQLPGYLVQKINCSLTRFTETTTVKRKEKGLVAL